MRRNTRPLGAYNAKPRSREDGSHTSSSLQTFGYVPTIDRVFPATFFPSNEKCGVDMRGVALTIGTTTQLLLLPHRMRSYYLMACILPFIFNAVASCSSDGSALKRFKRKKNIARVISRWLRAKRITTRIHRHMWGRLASRMWTGGGEGMRTV